MFQLSTFWELLYCLGSKGTDVIDIGESHLSLANMMYHKYDVSTDNFRKRFIVSILDRIKAIKTFFKRL